MTVIGDGVEWENNYILTWLCTSSPEMKEVMVKIRKGALLNPSSLKKRIRKGMVQKILWWVLGALLRHYCLIFGEQ